MDLLQYKDKLIFKNQSEKKYVFDPVRKKYVVLTPEEMVRQLFVHYLIEEHNISKKHIAVEKQILILDKKIRFDLLVFDKQGNPKMIVECKAHTVNLNDNIATQIGKYNYVINSKYICLTNGIETRFYVIDYNNSAVERIEEETINVLL